MHSNRKQACSSLFSRAASSLLFLALLAPMSGTAADGGASGEEQIAPSMPVLPGGALGSADGEEPAPGASVSEEPGDSLGGGGSRSGSSSRSSSVDGDDGDDDVEITISAPKITPAKTVKIHYPRIEVFDLVKLFAEITGKNFIVKEKDLSGELTIISHKPVSPGAAYKAFLAALEVAGYTTSASGNTVKIVKADGSEKANIPVNTDTGAIPWSDQFITQLIPLDNVPVGEVQSLAQSLASAEANIIAYATTNTLIVTDSAYNIRKIFKILSELDVAAPKSALKIFRIQHADATQLQTLIEQLFGTAETSTSQANNTTNARNNRNNRRNRRNRGKNTPKPASTDGVSAGKAAKYIDKVMADERTNSLIVRANEEGMTAVDELIRELDVDFSPENRSQIYVINLEHAKAEEVVDVLSRLSGGSGNRSGNRGNARNNRPGARSGASGARTNPRGQPPRPGTAGADAGGAEGGALAAFDSGMRIAHDESTNSLVIIAAPEDYRVVRRVVDRLDKRRRQVFVDAVILELSSQDEFQLGVAAHMPTSPAEGAAGILSGQFGTQSLGLSQELLSGLALGVFGESIEVPFADGQTLSVPGFGIVLHALKTNSGVNIVSNPNLLTLDNTEARITVGRKVPFPNNTTFNNLTGQPVISYTREDVAIELELTPRINSSNYVTLDVRVQVAEVEEDTSNLDVAAAGFITSKREVETAAVVRDNQTVVLGGLVGTTETEVETKVPLLGDLPLVGALFRGKRKESRKSNLLIFLTPHIVDGPEDMIEIQKVKEAQFREFRRRFYGKSREKQVEELQKLLSYSMNRVDEPSRYRTKPSVEDVRVDGLEISDETRDALREELDSAAPTEPGAGAGEPPEGDVELPEDGEDLAIPEGGDVSEPSEEE